MTFYNLKIKGAYYEKEFCTFNGALHDALRMQ